jgi:hypothetical protein
LGGAVTVGIFDKVRAQAKAEVLRSSADLLQRVAKDIKSKDGRNAMEIAVGLLKAKQLVYEQAVSEMEEL